MKIELRKICPAGILSGARSGGEFRSSLLSQIHDPHNPEPCFLDFGGIEVATASFLREGIVIFKENVRANTKNLYPIIANAAPQIKEELEIVLNARGDAILSCFFRDKEALGREVWGGLDAKQKLTFDLVDKHDVVDAGLLHRTYSEEGVGITAWNNRLSTLANNGLIIEVPNGRAKTYRPVLVGGSDGC